MTDGCTLLVGYNTAQTLPPLPNRNIVVDGRDMLDISNIDWCIGGSKTYEKYCHLFSELHISHINDDTVGDTLKPELKGLSKDCLIYEYFF